MKNPLLIRGYSPLSSFRMMNEIKARFLLPEKEYTFRLLASQTTRGLASEHNRTMKTYLTKFILCPVS